MKLSRIMFNVGIALPLVCGIPARAGNVFVSDSGDGTIVQFDSAGNESVFVSGLNNPAGLAFDESGNLYVANSGAGTILRFDGSGTASVFASGLNNPGGLAFDNNGNLYVASQNDGTILRYGSDGIGSAFASGLSAPQYLAFGNTGNLYVSTGSSIQEFDSIGNQTTIFSAFNDVYGLAADSSGDLYASLQNIGSITRILGSGGPGAPFQYPYTINPFELDPLGLAFDGSGNLYATFSELGYWDADGQSDLLNGVVMEFNPNGTGAIIAAGLSDPRYIAVQGTQGVTVQFVPEPSSWNIAIAGLCAWFAGRSLRMTSLWHMRRLLCRW